MSKIIIAGNWKQNGTLSSSVSLTKKIISAINKNAYKHEIIIFPPSIFLHPLKDLAGKNKIKIGAQNVSAYDNGAYTGEISAAMLKDTKIDYCLVGHSERRHIINEDESVLSNKVSRLLENNIKIIYCIGETLDEYKRKKTKSILKRQLKNLFKNDTKYLKQYPTKIVIAYEPVWAIGSGLVPTQSELDNIFSFIKKSISGIDKCYTSIKLLYGGSVSSDNASSLMKTKYIDGLLVGGASLISKKFIEICSTI